jgi:excinuclease ABC subunit B
MDADKEGFLRSTRSLTQTAGRAARHLEGRVIMYADKITESMQRTIDETERRRTKQMAYNEEHNITPQALRKSKEQILKQTKVVGSRATTTYETGASSAPIAAEADVKYMSKEELQKTISKTRKAMEQAAKELDFIEAARLRDELFELEKLNR